MIRIDFLSDWHLVPFDASAADEFERLRKQRVRIGTQDLKIAATTIAHDALLLTANLRDFRQVLDSGQKIGCIRDGMQMIARRTNGQDADVIGRYAVPGQLPCWLRLTRSGDTYVGAYSDDGTNWQQLGSCQVTFSSGTNLAGLAVSSHDTTKLRGGSFSDVSVINR